VLLVLAAEFLCAAALSTSALLHERHSRLRSFDAILQGRSDSLLGAIQDAEDPEDNVAIDPAELRLPEGDVYAAYNEGGRLLGSSKNAPDVLIDRQNQGYSVRRFHRRTYRVLQRNALRIIDRAETNGIGLRRPVTIVYAAPTGHIWHEIFEAARFDVAVSLGLLLLTAAFLIVLLRKVLQPIADLAAETMTLSKDSLHFEPPASALRVRELAPLANTLSTTIASLHRAFQSEHRFVSDAAHELKTAVAVVRSTIQVLMMRSRSIDEYGAAMNRLLDDNKRVEDLVSRMLVLAHLEEQSGPEMETIHLGELVRRTVKNLRTFAEAHSVELIAETNDEPVIHLACEKADVLISNLIVNSIQHSPPASTVTVQTFSDATTVRMAVRDHGTGISPDALPHVFERFYREDSSRSRLTGGVGLGLAICKSIVEAAGGAIAIESKLGAGTTVTVTFSQA
jgi:signal transduction histidine kinase